MYYKAYNTLILPDGTHHNLVVVHFNKNGQYQGFHPLIAEEPFVEWIGGTLDLSTTKDAK